MTPDQFEQMCIQSLFRPTKRVKTRHGNILIAETCSRPDYSGEIDEPHWQTLWALERDDVKEAQVIHFEGMGSSQRARTDATVSAAMDWLSVNLEGGRYDA